jgi:TatD DNase family protein
MKLVDVHCHLESHLYEGKLDDIVREARECGLVKIITSAITPDEWDISRQIAEQFDIVAYSIGIHPWYVKPIDLDSIDSLVEHSLKGAIAIGEVGLDKKVATPDFELQLRMFTRQLIAARELELPLIVHCRGAYNELITCFKHIGVSEAGGIVHSFSGSPEIAEELIKYGFGFSMGGVLTYRNSKKRQEVLRFIYPEHFMLETDSPDIPPVEAKGTLHTPANIRYNLRAASEILGISEEKIAETTTENAFRMFKLNSPRGFANRTGNI